MVPDDSATSWHATDDETPVPVRSSVPSGTESRHRDPAQDITAGSTEHVVLSQAPALRSQTSMRLAAFLGIAIVLGIVGMTVGFGTIFGDLTGTDTPSTTVEITADGVFSPESLTLSPGDTMTLVNKNPDPQVIKSKDERELFGVQVLFATPFSFTVPSDAVGTYTYFSETLPEDRTLTITIAAEVGATDTMSPADAPESIDIPLPFGDDAPVVASAVPADTVPSETVSAAPVVQTEHSGDTATISLRGNAAPSDDSEPTFTGQIPTNPYTIGSGKQSSTVAAENLHSGAPLQQITQHRPINVTSTGPTGMLLLLMPALLGVVFVYRKLRAA